MQHFERFFESKFPILKFLIHLLSNQFLRRWILKFRQQSWSWAFDKTRWAQNYKINIFPWVFEPTFIQYSNLRNFTSRFATSQTLQVVHNPKYDEGGIMDCNYLLELLKFVSKLSKNHCESPAVLMLWLQNY